MLICIIMTAVGFLSGSIMFSYILPRWLYSIDIRQYNEDGNPGSMNAIAASGLVVGLLCLVLDILKAAVPVYVAVQYLKVSGYALVPVMIAPVLGHAFSPFLGFRGGKAISVAFGSLLGVIHISLAVVILVLVMVFFHFIIVLSPDSSKVISAFALTSLIVLIFEPLIEIKTVVLIIGFVVCGKHLVNPNYGELHATVGPFKIFREGRSVKIKRRT